MHLALIVILCLALPMTFGFGMAWFVPLVWAREEEMRAAGLFQEPEGHWMVGADLLLMVLDCVPFFWVFRAIPELPSALTGSQKACLKETAGQKDCRRCSLDRCCSAQRSALAPCHSFCRARFFDSTFFPRTGLGSARRKWRQDGAVRGSFYASVFCGVSVAASGWLLAVW